MILPVGAIVAVADGQKVRLFRNTGAQFGVHLIEMTVNRDDRSHAGSGRHHNSSANPDERRLQEDDFAATTAALLTTLSSEGTIEHLVLVADPRTLGEMRKHFHRDFKSKIIGELAKDFTGRPIEDIAASIANA